MKRAFKIGGFYFGGDQPKVSWLERLRSALGAFIGLALVLALAKYLGDLNGINEWLITSLGASALLVFALPQSPMAQPWAVIAGNTVSALVGITLNHWISEPLIAMPMAATFSILGMFCLRCLHPPAAAVALLVVSGHVLHYRFAFFPVFIDSALLVIAGAIYSNLTGKAYPNRPQ
ncbi:HPP family protein [Polynucleobacter brandtiae]|uniref:CBS domain-containing membrane protein n=1 Tax=Polynucleobacter brandtiae TaxID=1938816 RepID=A0A2M8VR67_9BURK|nr:HPP family protein [Polynucleobacter brandtiae]PJI79962.1 CBS domain-containing membrane protein [Polynucleobacter brandtiae]